MKPSCRSLVAMVNLKPLLRIIWIVNSEMREISKTSLLYHYVLPLQKAMPARGDSDLKNFCI